LICSGTSIFCSSEYFQWSSSLPLHVPNPSALSVFFPMPYTSPCVFKAMICWIPLNSTTVVLSNALALIGCIIFSSGSSSTKSIINLI
uniref:Ovule protein n=1 Tax=Brugia timori TaxID=42155 RepID=A0A0R3Q883_9BILA